MAKPPRRSEITEADLVEFLETSSDFAFELRCLKTLTGLGFRSQHGGSYIDPVTKKPRQFDIRAEQEDGRKCVRFAVECKNLVPSYPLLVMCVPREPDESFHDLLFAYDPENPPTGVREPRSFDMVPAFRPNSKSIRVNQVIFGASAYPAGKPVGKSCAQVGIAQDKSIVSGDAEVFEKWSQALASAHDLADAAASYGELQKSAFASLILPILVVPDETLWRVDYTADGDRAANPIRVDRCSFFIGRDISAGDTFRSSTLTISHLEFVTLSGLEKLTHEVLDSCSDWFPFGRW